MPACRMLDGTIPANLVKWLQAELLLAKYPDFPRLSLKRKLYVHVHVHTDPIIILPVTTYRTYDLPSQQNPRNGTHFTLDSLVPVFRLYEMNDFRGKWVDNESIAQMHSYQYAGFGERGTCARSHTCIVVIGLLWLLLRKKDKETKALRSRLISGGDLRTSNSWGPPLILPCICIYIHTYI